MKRNNDELYMLRCIQLAKCGKAGAAPNPMVGAVIVHQNKIIGEGYHRQCGGPHAEVNAIASVKQPSLLNNSTIYISLEPCSHYGKTPPCVDLIIKHQIPRVVIGCIDPFAKVSGRGVKKLKEAGIEVCVGILEKECLALNRQFITTQTQKRPYILLKWAQSNDGFIDILRDKDEKPYTFSTPISSMLVHKYRAESMSILVGRRTALMDNPSLTVREWNGKQPLRLVIDRNLTLPQDLRLFTDGHLTLCFTHQKNKFINTESVTYIPLDFDSPILPQIMKILYERKVQSLMVEGGTQLLQSFIDDQLWDEAFVEKSKDLLFEGVKAPIMTHYNTKQLFSFLGNNITHYSRI